MKEIDEKVVIIMGASSGIGEATTKTLASRGTKVVIAARREDRLKSLKDSLAEASIDYVKADVTNFDDVKKVVDYTFEKYGKIDVMFNNAGIMPVAPISDLARDQWQQMVDINIMGVLNGIAAVLPIMTEQKSGHIISTDSVAGHVVYPGSAVYCGTKFAVRAIMEGLRQEQRVNNVKSTIVSPGAVSTELNYINLTDYEVKELSKHPQTSDDGALTAQDIADAVVFAIDTPDRMSVNNMVVRPTYQAI